jgi:concanavalin A-like lectin/glucanase superfamily protein
VKGALIVSLSLLAAATVSGAWADGAAHMQKVLATKDLIGLWAFENNFQDSTDHKNDAHAAGANTAMVTFGPGVNGGSAVQIDNTNDEGNFVEVNTPIGSIFDVPNITVVYWAKPTKLRPAVNSDGDPDSDQWNSLVDRNTLWYTELNTVIDTDSKKARLVVRLYDPGDGSGSTPQIGREVEAPDTSYIQANEWHQFAMTYDGKQVISYVDAKEVLKYDYDNADDHKLGPAPDIDKDAAPNWNLTWGLWKQRGDHYTGLFDDTAYFSRALSADELKGLYDAMLAAPATAGN